MSTPSESLHFSARELREQAVKLAKDELGVPLDEAWRKLDAGELSGTILEAELSGLRFLLNDQKAKE